MEEPIMLYAQIFAFLGIILLLGGVWVGVRWFAGWRRRQQQRQQELDRLGYEPLSALPAGLRERVSAVLGRLGDRGVRLGDLFHHPLPEGDLYLFKLVNRGEGEHTGLDSLLAVVAPALDLPRFRLMPRYQLPVDGHARAGVLAGAEQLLAAQGRTGGYRQINFAGSPTFCDRYLVFATDETETRHFLSRARRRALASIARRYRIVGVGDTFLLEAHLSPRALAAGVPPAPDEEARLADAQRILALFLAPPES